MTAPDTLGRVRLVQRGVKASLGASLSPESGTRGFAAHKVNADILRAFVFWAPLKVGYDF